MFESPFDPPVSDLTGLTIAASSRNRHAMDTANSDMPTRTTDRFTRTLTWAEGHCLPSLLPTIVAAEYIVLTTAMGRDRCDSDAVPQFESADQCGELVNWADESIPCAASSHPIDCSSRLSQASAGLAISQFRSSRLDVYRSARIPNTRGSHNT